MIDTTKYFPLIWAALSRKPARLALTFTSVVIAFILYGVTIGINAGFQNLIDAARLDRIHVSGNHAGPLMLAQRDQIGKLDNVSDVGIFDRVVGYHQNPKNTIAVLMMDRAMRNVFPDLPVSQQQWTNLYSVRDGVIFSQMMAERYDIDVGDKFPVVTQQPTRSDGSNLWTFEVVSIVDDIPLYPIGFAIGNYDFLDRARSLTESGKVGQFWVLAKDSAQVDELGEMIDQSFANSPHPTKSNSEKAIFESIGGSDSEVALGATMLAGAGILMIIVLTTNAIAQSVRERMHEFAVMKTLGFTDTGVVVLVFAEAAAPCLLGCVTGLALAKALSVLLPHLLPSGVGFPMPYVSSSVLVSAIGAAVAVAFISSVVPASRIARLEVAVALSRR